jgi:hypothetical protein
MGRFKSDAQRKAAFANMRKSPYTKRQRQEYMRQKTVANRIGAAFGLPTQTKVSSPIKPSDEKRSVVKCPNVQCPSSECTFLELGPKNSTTYKAAIPILGVDYTSYQNVAYFKCNSCNTIFYTIPVSAT